MAGKNAPRKGSMAYYPKKRAKKETPVFDTFPKLDGKEVKILNFWGYKAGMVHGQAKNVHKKSTTFNQEIFVPSTILECPPVKVLGVRVFAKSNYGTNVLGEAWSEKKDKHLSRKILNIEKQKKAHSLEELEKRKSEFVQVRLLVHLQPHLTSLGKKKPEVSEIVLSGTPEQQWEFAKQKFGGEIKVEDVFKETQFVDAKAVSLGKGTQGEVKRFGVKTFGNKAKYHRKPGTYGPWNPATIMFTVARMGQLGYQSRTEFNKRILKIAEKPEGITPSGGFEHYGDVRNSYLIIAGSLPGPVKRLVALRQPMRRGTNKFEVQDLQVVNA
ncbi:MAG: 50S ribosomal protein L3 [Candidatus Diapherotrites archaeon]